MGHIKDGCDKFSNIKKMVIDNQGAFDLENVEQNKCAIKFRGEHKTLTKICSTLRLLYIFQ